MKKVNFIFVGSPKEAAFKALEDQYRTKINRYVDSEILYLKDSLEKDATRKREKESLAIIDSLKPGDWVALCDEHGKPFHSLPFSKELRRWQEQGKRVVFIVGGAYGVSDALSKKAHTRLALSEFTLPHELARTVILEQVYRALTILNGEKYHHE